MNIKLTRPVTYKDTELDTLALDLDGLTGNDLVQAEENLRRSHPDAPLWGTQHMAAIAAKASHLPAEFVMKLPAKDFLSVTVQVMSFFGGISSETSAQEITGD